MDNCIKINMNTILEVFGILKSLEGNKFNKEAYLFQQTTYHNIEEIIEEYVSKDKFEPNEEITVTEVAMTDFNRRIVLDFDDGSTENIDIDLGTILDDENYMEIRNTNNCIIIILKQWKYGRLVKLYMSDK